MVPGLETTLKTTSTLNTKQLLCNTYMYMYMLYTVLVPKCMCGNSKPTSDVFHHSFSTTLYKVKFQIYWTFTTIIEHAMSDYFHTIHVYVHNYTYIFAYTYIMNPLRNIIISLL